MFESLVATVLNTVLGDYVANLERKQLNIGIWSGNVVLNNLSLKREALEKFNLPIDVREGYLGELVLKIPWSDLKNSPIRVQIKDLFILAEPREDEDFDAEEAEDRENQRKQEQLKLFEVLQEAKFGPKASNNGEGKGSFYAQLVTKIIDNIQVSVENIHVRYEDNVSNPGNPFAIGFKLHKLSMVSTDENFVESFISKPVDAIHKLLSLNDLTIFFCTASQFERVRVHNFRTASLEAFAAQNVLKPINGLGKIRINKKFGAATPRTACSLEFDEITFTLDDEQYRDGILCADHFNFLFRRQLYAKYRPPAGIRPMEAPLTWFRFAATTVLREVQQRRRQWTWEYFAERRDQRKRYIALFTKLQTTALSSKEKIEFDGLERRLSFDDLRFYRLIARQEMKKKELDDLKNKPKAATPAQPARSGWGWFRKNSAGEDVQGPLVTEEEIKQLYEAIDYDDEVLTTDQDFPREFRLLQVDALLASGSIKLRQSPHSTPKELVIVNYKGLRADFLQRPTSTKAAVELQTFDIQDPSTTTLFPQIAQVQEEETDDVGSPFFFVEFESNPLGGDADANATVKMRGILFVFNVDVVVRLKKFFEAPRTALESINALVDAAEDTFEGLKEQTRAGLQYALEEHKTLDLKLDIAAPKFILPQSCTQTSSFIVLVDTGHVSLHSDVVSKSQKAEINALQGKQLSSVEIERLQSFMYDRYDLALTSVQLVMGRTVEDCIKLVKAAEDERNCHVLDRVDLKFKLESCILPKARNLTSMKLRGRLPNLVVKLSAFKYRALFELFDVIMDKMKDETPSLPPTKTITEEKMIHRPKATFFETQEAKSPSESDDEDTFFDAEELPLAADKGGVMSPRKKLVEFTFEIGEVGIHLSRSKAILSSQLDLLAILKLKSFRLDLTKRPCDLYGSAKLAYICIEDFVDKSSKFMLSPLKDATEESMLSVGFSKKDALSSTELALQTLDIDLAPLEAVASSKTVPELIRFFQTMTTRVSALTGNEAADEFVSTKSNVNLKLRCRCIQAVMRDEYGSFMAAQVSELVLNVDVEDPVTRVEAQVSSMLLGKAENGNGDELIAARNDLLAVKLDLSPEETFVQVRAGEVQVTVVEELIIRLLRYGDTFKQLSPSINDESSTEISPQLPVSKLKFDVTLASPIVHLPCGASEEMLFYLGDFSTSGLLNANAISVKAGLEGSKLVHTSDGISYAVISDIHSHIEFEQQPERMTVMVDISPILVKLSLNAILGGMRILHSIQRITSQMAIPPSTETPQPSMETKTKVVPIAAQLKLASCQMSLVKATDTEFARLSLDDFGIIFSSSEESGVSVNIILTEISLQDATLIPTSLIRKQVGETPQLKLAFSTFLNQSSVDFQMSTFDGQLSTCLINDLLQLLNEVSLEASRYTLPTTTVEAQSSVADMAMSAVKLSFSLDHAAIILHESPSRMDRSFVSLEVSKCELSKSDVAELSLIGLTVSLGTANVAPFVLVNNVNMNGLVDNRSDSVHLQRMKVEASISPIAVSLSVSDVFRIQRLVSELSLPSTTPAGVSSPPTRIVATKERTRVLPVEELLLTFEGLALHLMDEAIVSPLCNAKLGACQFQVYNWSTDLRFVAPNIPLSAAYFNLRNSHWEPIVEPWMLTVMLRKEDDKISLEAGSTQVLNVNVSHALISDALSLSKRTVTEAQRINREQHSPYVIQNDTGCGLFVWSETGDHADETVERLEAGKEVSWKFYDMKTFRQATDPGDFFIGAQLEGIRTESLKKLSVSRESVQQFTLKPAIDSVYHKIACEISLQGDIKYVRFRSVYQIMNGTGINLDVGVVSTDQSVTVLSTLAPGAKCSIPILQCHKSRIALRPEQGFGYDWSDAMSWQTFVRTPAASLLCSRVGERSAPFYFDAAAEWTSEDKSYPALTLHIRPPVTLENLLPYETRFRMIDRTANREFSTSIQSGSASPVHIVKAGHLLLMNAEIIGTNFASREFAIVESSIEEDLPVDQQLVLLDRASSQNLLLNVTRTYVGPVQSSVRITISVPYVILDTTDLGLLFMSKQTLFSAGRIEHGQHPYQHTNIKWKPMLWSYEDSTAQPVNFDAAGTTGEITMLSESKTRELHIGSDIKDGTGKFRGTKVIKFHPRFVFRNECSIPISIREANDNVVVTLREGEQRPLYSLKASSAKKFVVSRTGGVDKSWTSSFVATDIGKVHLRLPGDDTELLRCDTVLHGATLFVTISIESGKWPFRIENNTDFSIQYYQQVTEQATGAILKPVKYSLSPRSMAHYAWDYPCGFGKQLTININGRERDIPINEIGPLLPFKVPRSGRVAVVSMDIIADGPVQVLRISDYNQRKSIYRIKDQEDAFSDGFDIIDATTKGVMTIRLDLEGIGLSIINRHLKELLYVTMRGFSVVLSESTVQRSIEVKVKWFQIDNQLFGTVYPILMYPTVLRNVPNQQDMHPAIQAALIHTKDSSHGVYYVKYFTVLLQEFSVEADEDLLYAILDFTTFPTTETIEINPFAIKPLQPAQGKVQEEVQMFFEALHIQPLKLNLSFARTNALSTDQSVSQSANPLAYVFNVISFTVGNINEAPVYLNALFIENLQTTPSVLVERLSWHYEQEAVLQMYKIIGAADILGNPVGLFNNLSSGVMDIFYEPIQGFIMSDRPQDIGYGLVKGTGSFLKKTVFGVTDSVTKFTSSVGKGLSAATLDSSFQNRRRIAYTRNRPKHALAGVTHGANSLASSVVSGVTGVLTQPIKGAEAEGVSGFFKGIGKGLVGVVTKPMVGIADFASNITEGIRNTTTAFDSNEIDRIRLPRHIPADGILKRYAERDAVGQKMLFETKNGRFSNEFYISHIEIPEENVYVIVSNLHMICITVGSLHLQWAIPMTDIKRRRSDKRGITLLLKDGSEIFLFIPDDTHRASFSSVLDKMSIR